MGIPPAQPSGSTRPGPIPTSWFILLAVGILGLVAVGGVFLIGTILLRAFDSTVDEVRYDVEAGIELGDVEAGCINLGETALDGEVCLTMVDGELEVQVAGFQPGSDLTVTGSDGDSLVVSVDADGGHTSRLSGAITDGPVTVSGTLADGRSAGVEVGVLD